MGSASIHCLADLAEINDQKGTMGVFLFSRRALLIGTVDAWKLRILFSKKGHMKKVFAHIVLKKTTQPVGTHYTAFNMRTTLAVKH